MQSKQELISELDKIVAHTTEQTIVRRRSNDYLYVGLAWVYLWWVRASKVDGFLEEQYAKFKITGRNTEGEEKFTQILRLTWRLDWADESKATLQQWSNALRKIHTEYTSNSNAYKTNAQEKLVQFIEGKGGLRALIGADKYYIDTNAEVAPKSKSKGGRTADETEIIANKHLELGELHFANAKSISSIQTTKPIPVNRKGYALALIKVKRNGIFDVLATVSEEKQIREAIVASYKRSNDAAPTVLQQLAEVINTQAIPLSLEKHRNSLQDTKKLKDEKGEFVSATQYKRVLFRKQQNDILLSENKTDCSVVTIAKPHQSILASSKDVFMRVQDRRYLEQAVLQLKDLSIYTTNDKEKIPVVRDTDVAASHKLVLENKLLNTKRALYFYTIDSVKEFNRPQAYLNADYSEPVLWQASVDTVWIESLYAAFVGAWLNEYGQHITRPQHKTIRIEFGKTQLVFKHYGERGNLTTSSKIFDLKNVGSISKPIKPIFLTKDLMPVLAALVQAEIEGQVKLSVNNDLLVIAYKTALATYQISVPTCSLAGKRNTAAFAAYGEVDD
jgi:D-ribose pyranose/furanose isomerase RbsD